MTKIFGLPANRFIYGCTGMKYCFCANMFRKNVLSNRFSYRHVQFSVFLLFLFWSINIFWIVVLLLDSCWLIDVSFLYYRREPFQRMEFLKGKVLVDKRGRRIPAAEALRVRFSVAEPARFWPAPGIFSLAPTPIKADFQPLKHFLTTSHLPY